MSGMRFFCWASSWMCSSITPSTSIKVQQHGLSSAISDHLFSFFRGRASSWRVLLVVLPKRGYLRPCAIVFAQYVLGCSSSVPRRHRHQADMSTIIRARKMTARLTSWREVAWVHHLLHWNNVRELSVERRGVPSLESRFPAQQNAQRVDWSARSVTLTETLMF